jgi:hypothetical protein
MQPQKPPPSHRQEPQWHTSPPTLADIGYEVRRLGRGLRGIGRDIWTLGGQGIREAVRDTRAFMRHPPHWFWVALVSCGVLFDILCAISLRNYFTYHAPWTH